MLKRTTTPSESSHADFGDLLSDVVTPTCVIRRRRHPGNEIDLRGHPIDACALGRPEALFCEGYRGSKKWRMDK